MGCSPSAVVSPEHTEISPTNGVSTKNKHDLNQQTKIPPIHNGYEKGLDTNQNHPNGISQQKRQGVDKNANKLNPLAQAPVPKSVAFDVTLDGQLGDGLLVVKKRPPRLQALDPLPIPKLTQEQLAEKQRLADEKRERLKQKKIKTSEKSSRRRQELLKAREFGLKQQMEQEKEVIDGSLRQAEIKREQRLLEIKEKQRIREERARRIRERAKQIQNPDDAVEVEKDEEFNAASDDSWLGNEDKPSESGQKGDDNTLDEDEGVLKPVRRLDRPTISASTVDSYDAAFQRRTGQAIPEKSYSGGQLNDDEFFGS